MARLRLNNVGDPTGTTNPVTLTDDVTTTCSWSIAPEFATITGDDYYLVIAEQGTANEEIMYLTAYTSGDTAGTVARAAEPTAAGQSAFAHAGTAWIHGPTAQDLDEEDWTFIDATFEGSPYTAPNSGNVGYVCDPTDGGIVINPGDSPDTGQLIWVWNSVNAVNTVTFNSITIVPTALGLFQYDGSAWVTLITPTTDQMNFGQIETAVDIQITQNTGMGAHFGVTVFAGISLANSISVPTYLFPSGQIYALNDFVMSTPATFELGIGITALLIINDLAGMNSLTWSLNGGCSPGDTNVHVAWGSDGATPDITGTDLTYDSGSNTISSTAGGTYSAYLDVSYNGF